MILRELNDKTRNHEIDEKIHRRTNKNRPSEVAHNILIQRIPIRN
jgi:hypothetical protein